MKQLLKKTIRKLYYRWHNNGEIWTDAYNVLRHKEVENKDQAIQLAEDLLIKNSALDYAKITRSQLQDFNVSTRKRLTEEEKKKRMDDCILLMQNQTFQEIKNEFIFDCKEYLLLQASGFDANFKRGEISGAMTLYDLIKTQASHTQNDDEDDVLDVTEL